MKTICSFAVLISVAFISAEQVSRSKCQEYNELLKKKNICNTGKYPFVGAIGFDDENNIKWGCSAALISDKYVLTVAHCAYDRENGRAQYVRLGAADSTDYSKAKVFNISIIFFHPDYKPPSVYNDIAVFKLKKPVEFDEFIQPACLYSGEDLTEYDVAGYSFRSMDRDSPEGVFVHEKVKVATKEECFKTFVGRRKLREGVDFDKQFCNIEGDGSSKVNSAGVFLQKDEKLSCMQNIAGLVDIGIFSKKIGLNVKVSSYVNWTEWVVW